MKVNDRHLLITGKSFFFIITFERDDNNTGL